MKQLALGGSIVPPTFETGITAYLEKRRRELQVMMAQTGAASIAKIRRDSVVTRG